MKNIILAAIGFAMFALGTIGIVVPLLPTTPFYILAAACFSATPALHTRMMKIPFFNEYISNYKARNGISRKTVIVSLVFLWTMLTISAIIVKRPWIILCLIIVGISVTTHILIVSKPRTHKNKHIDEKSA